MTLASFNVTQTNGRARWEKIGEKDIAHPDYGNLGRPAAKGNTKLSGSRRNDAIE